MKTLNLRYAKRDEVREIPRCSHCENTSLPCLDCGARARKLEKEGYIILLEGGFYIPIPEGDDGDGQDD